MSISISYAGLYNPSEFKAWSLDKQRDINKRVKRAMFEMKPVIEKTIGAEINKSLNVKKANFAKAFKGYVNYSNESKPPVMVVASKIPWLSGHITGLNIGPKRSKGLLIPINTKALKSGSTRIGYRAWQKKIQTLAAQGNLHFVKRGNKVLVLAELAGAGNALNRHNKRTSADRYSKRRSLEIPIAVMVPSVTIKRRLNVEALAKGPLARLMRAAVDKAMQA